MPVRPIRGGAGRLRHRVKLQQPVRGRDGTGGVTITWSDLETVWGEVEPLRGDERVVDGAVQDETTHTVRIRANAVASIDPTMRWLYGARVLNILSVIDRKEGGVEVVTLCKEIPRDG